MNASAFLVTGFLGSGKTTFILNSLLAQYKDRKPAIIVNDFGDVSYDRIRFYLESLPVMGIEGKCFCCDGSGELLEALYRVRNTAEALIIETSGLSDPFPVMEAMELSGFNSYIVICVVPADNWCDLRNEPVFTAQLQYADCIVITKCDTVTNRELKELMEALDEKPAFLCCEGVVEDNFFNFVEAIPMRRTDKFKNRLSESARNRFSQTTLYLSGYYSMYDIEVFLNKLPRNVIRAKGFLKVVESPFPVGINWTRNHMSWSAVEYVSQNFITFIGYGSLLLPPFPEKKDLDWQKMLPLGEFDRRYGIAYLDGNPVPEITAVEWLITQDLSDSVLITSSCSLECPINFKSSLIVQLNFEDIYIVW
jgi:G3E family GTPase